MRVKEDGRKRAVALGIRIGLVFLMALAVLILVAYYVLSQNFHRLLTDYSVTLVRSMLSQGVTMVEDSLSSGRREARLLADAFNPPQEGETARFPSQLLSDEDVLRLLYVTPQAVSSSDGAARDVRGRPDIRAAFSGETAVYGPCFDEDGAYLISFSAPVLRDGEIVGVISIERDGYLFCDLIRDIRFMDTGESYIINAEGTDIAVSDPNHIDWVNTGYNGRELLRQEEDPVTRTIVELEQKGLDGESGFGTYLWNDGVVYVLYEPIPSCGWVLLGGLREEEIAAMTQSALFASISKGPSLALSLIVFLGLVALIVFWIIADMKKNAEINEKLELIANHDSLTGLLNRRFLENELTEQWKYPVKISGQAAIFMADIDNFKSYNDHFGHPKGDDCLRMVAGVIKNAFDGREGYVVRYGGEEFMAAVFLLDRRQAMEMGNDICRRVEARRLPDSHGGVVTVSIGICHVNLTADTSLFDCIKVADKALYSAKKEGKNRAVLLDAFETDATPPPAVLPEAGGTVS